MCGPNDLVFLHEGIKSITFRLHHMFLATCALFLWSERRERREEEEEEKERKKERHEEKERKEPPLCLSKLLMGLERFF